MYYLIVGFHSLEGQCVGIKAMQLLNIQWYNELARNEVYPTIIVYHAIC